MVDNDTLSTGLSVTGWCVVVFICGCAIGMVWIHEQTGRLAAEPRWIKWSVFILVANSLTLAAIIGDLIWSKAISPTLKDSDVYKWQYIVFTLAFNNLLLVSSAFHLIQIGKRMQVTCTDKFLHTYRKPVLYFFALAITAEAYACAVILVQMFEINHEDKLDGPMWIVFRESGIVILFVVSGLISLGFGISAYAAHTQRKKLLLVEEIPLSTTGSHRSTAQDKDKHAPATTTAIVVDLGQTMNKTGGNKRVDILREIRLIDSIMSVVIGFITLGHWLPNLVLRFVDPMSPVIFICRYPVVAWFFFSVMLYILLPLAVNKELNVSRQRRNRRSAISREQQHSGLLPSPSTSLPSSPSLNASAAAQADEASLTHLQLPLDEAGQAEGSTRPPSPPPLMPSPIVPDLVEKCNELRRLESEHAERTGKNEPLNKDRSFSLPPPPRISYRQRMRAQRRREESAAAAAAATGTGSAPVSSPSSSSSKTGAMPLTSEAQILFWGDVLSCTPEDDEPAEYLASFEEAEQAEAESDSTLGSFSLPSRRFSRQASGARPYKMQRSSTSAGSAS